MASKTGCGSWAISSRDNSADALLYFEKHRQDETLMGGVPQSHGKLYRAHMGGGGGSLLDGIACGYCRESPCRCNLERQGG